MSDNQDDPKLSPLELMRVAGMPEIVRLTGLDVKAHHYRQHGIPPKLLRKWTAERRRRAWEIAKLQTEPTA